MASAGVTWLASSKIDDVEVRASAGSSWLTTSGLIAQHGFRRSKHLGRRREQLAQRQVASRCLVAWFLTSAASSGRSSWIAVICSAYSRQSRLAVCSMWTRSPAR